MTQGEVKRFFSVITDRHDKALFGLIYLYGPRAGEAGLLKVSDIDFEQDRLFIPWPKNSYAGVKSLRQDARTV